MRHAVTILGLAVALAASAWAETAAPSKARRVKVAVMSFCTQVVEALLAKAHVLLPPDGVALR